MKNEGSWLTAALSLLVGILLVVFHNHMDLITWIVEAIGILIVVPAVWLILTNCFGKDGQRNYLVVFAAVVALAFGLWVCFAPGTFASIIIYIFAAVLIVAGVYHICTISALGRDVRVPLWVFIIPALLIVCGLAFIFTGLKLMTAVVVLIMGIALIASALTTVIEGINRARRSHQHTQITEGSKEVTK